MNLAARLVVGLVAALHVYFLVLEMFLWQTRFGRRALKSTAEQAAATAVLAKNQGLYNGFLAAGLVWGLMRDSFEIKTFFLACIIVAGVYGAATASRAIIFIQALPAAIALALVWAAR